MQVLETSCCHFFSQFPVVADMNNISFLTFLVQDEMGHYKNLLQELGREEGFCMPTYKTVKFGASHMPTFSSTVEVKGERFCGKAGKSKKQAELSAAKVAYISLKQRKLNYFFLF